MDIVVIIGYLAAFGTTVSFLPQAIKTIQTKNTSGISLYMYALFTAGTLLWMIYGFMIHSLPVALANVITFVFASIILFISCDTSNWTALKAAGTPESLQQPMPR